MRAWSLEEMRDGRDLQQVLKEMVVEVVNGPEIYRPSRFWEQLNDINKEMLEELGIENFKRSVAQNYFNWLVTTKEDPQYRSVRKLWARRPSLQPYLNRMEKPSLLRTVQPYLNRLKDPALLESAMGPEKRIGAAELRVYKLFVGMLYEYSIQQDWSKIGKRVREPSLGNPINLFRRGKPISQDLANSIREYNAILSDSKELVSTSKRVAELGAGYGRVAHIFLSDDRTKYFVFDIPPALHVAQWYLSAVHPRRRVFHFRHIDRFSDVIDDLGQSDLAFFTPNQFEVFPDGFFDIFISISTLPEMRMEQIINYLRQAERLTSRYIYLKQWLTWENTLDGHRVTPGTIKLSGSWSSVFDRNDAVQPLFFERLWRRRPSPSGQI
jgi:putative sugar O-methyltransferase